MAASDPGSSSISSSCPNFNSSMAARNMVQTFGLRTDPAAANHSSRSLVFVKLTDSSLKAIEEYIRASSSSSSSSSCKSKPMIQFDHKRNQGVISIPVKSNDKSPNGHYGTMANGGSGSQSDESKRFNFSISSATEIGPKGSFECIKQRNCDLNDNVCHQGMNGRSKQPQKQLINKSKQVKSKSGQNKKSTKTKKWTMNDSSEDEFEMIMSNSGSEDDEDEETSDGDGITDNINKFNLDQDDNLKIIDIVGEMTFKMTISATEDSFENTKNKMSNVILESKKNCTKVINQSGLKVSNSRNNGGKHNHNHHNSKFKHSLTLFNGHNSPNNGNMKKSSNSFSSNSVSSNFGSNTKLSANAPNSASSRYSGAKVPNAAKQNIKPYINNSNKRSCDSLAPPVVETIEWLNPSPPDKNSNFGSNSGSSSCLNVPVTKKVRNSHLGSNNSSPSMPCLMVTGPSSPAKCSNSNLNSSNSNSLNSSNSSNNLNNNVSPVANSKLVPQEPSLKLSSSSSSRHNVNVKQNFATSGSTSNNNSLAPNDAHSNSSSSSSRLKFNGSSSSSKNGSCNLKNSYSDLMNGWANKPTSPLVSIAETKVKSPPSVGSQSSCLSFQSCYNLTPSPPDENINQDQADQDNNKITRISDNNLDQDKTPNLESLKSHFEQLYQEYKPLQMYHDTIERRFKKLAEELKNYLEGSDDWIRIYELMLKEYDELKNDSKFKKSNEKYKKLTSQLRELKKQIKILSKSSSCNQDNLSSCSSTSASSSKSVSYQEYKRNNMMNNGKGSSSSSRTINGSSSRNGSNHQFSSSSYQDQDDDGDNNFMDTSDTYRRSKVTESSKTHNNNNNFKYSLAAK